MLHNDSWIGFSFLHTVDKENHSLPRSYDRQSFRQYWIRRPISVVSRFGTIGYELGPTLASYVYHKNSSLLPWSSVDEENNNERKLETQHQQAVQFREALTNLGPAFVKIGQQVAIRPDLVPPAVLKELQKLCDSVRPVPDEIAMQVLKDELFGSLPLEDEDNESSSTKTTPNRPTKSLDDLFEDLHLVASASLGQVYKARLKSSGELVAIKVQRPDMEKAFGLDLFLLQMYGDFVDAFTNVFTKQIAFHSAFFDAFSKGSYSELDYENEARNQMHFQKELADRKSKVKVPNVYTEHSTRHVLTTEWIEGVKLADSSKETIRKLIPVGVELFLTQLLDMGTFHSDPHPGNLLVTEEGTLCLIDFGLCAEVEVSEREAMTKAIVHLLYRDFDSLIHKDTKELGFLPHDFDTEELTPILTKVLTGGLLQSGSDLHKRKRKLMEISNELNEIFFRYPFQVPGFFALVTRGLGLLEGIALVGDPDFDIFLASAPYATKRAVSILGQQATGYRRFSKFMTARTHV
jgi:aarF domain-containing kinase